MIKNKNLLVLVLLVLIVGAAAAAALILRNTDARTADPGREVRIFLDGKLYQTVHLGTPQEIAVRQDNGAVNVIAVDSEGVWMKSSTCRNQLCVEQGKVTYGNYKDRYYGTNIICLPNRVTVELALSEDERDPGAPDV